MRVRFATTDNAVRFLGYGPTAPAASFKSMPCIQRAARQILARRFALFFQNCRKSNEAPEFFREQFNSAD